MPVDRLSARIDDAAQPALGRTDGAGGRGHDSPAAAADAVQRGERHCKGMTAREADDFAWDFRGRRLDRQPGSHGHGVDWSGDFDHQPAHRNDPSVDFDAIDVDDLLGQGFYRVSSSLRTAPSARAGTRCKSGHKPALRLTGSLHALTWCLPASLIIGSFVHGTKA